MHCVITSQTESPSNVISSSHQRFCYTYSHIGLPFAYKSLMASAGGGFWERAASDRSGESGRRFRTRNRRGCDRLMPSNATADFARPRFLDVFLHKSTRVEVQHQSRSSDTISASVLAPGLTLAAALPGFSLFPFQSANPEPTKLWILSSSDSATGMMRPTSVPRSVITTVFPFLISLMYPLSWALSARIPTLFSAIYAPPHR